MPSDEKVVKNVEFDEKESKKTKKSKLEEEEKLTKDEEDSEEEDDDYEEEDESDDDEDDDDNDADGLTDVGLYNVLGNFLVDEDGNSIGVSLSNIAKELSKLNHTLKKYSNKN